MHIGIEETFLKLKYSKMTIATFFSNKCVVDSLNKMRVELRPVTIWPDLNQFVVRSASSTTSHEASGSIRQALLFTCT